MILRLPDGTEIDTDKIPGVEVSNFGFHTTKDARLELFFLRDSKIVAKIEIPREHVVAWFQVLAQAAIHLKIPPTPQSGSPKPGH